VARTAAYEIERRYRAVEHVARLERLREHLAGTLAKPEFHDLLVRLSDPKLTGAERESLQEQFIERPDRKALQEEFAASIPSATRPRERDGVASWFFCDANGVQVLRAPETENTIGKDFAWRTYFHGGPSDQEETWRPAPGEHIRGTTLSDVYQSKATSRWIVAIATPVFGNSPEKFLGVVAMTVAIGRFVEFDAGENQFAVLVNNREGKNKGVVLQHPLFDKLVATSTDKRLPDRFTAYRVNADDLPNTPDRQEHYSDPLAVAPEGGEYAQKWLAQMEPVRMGDKDTGKDTGWIVIVQEAYQSAIGDTLDELTRGLVRSGAIALGLIALVMAALWGMAKRLSMNQ